MTVVETLDASVKNCSVQDGNRKAEFMRSGISGKFKS